MHLTKVICPQCMFISYSEIIYSYFSLLFDFSLCVCVSVHARACVCMCVCVHACMCVYSCRFLIHQLLYSQTAQKNSVLPLQLSLLLSSSQNHLLPVLDLICHETPGQCSTTCKQELVSLTPACTTGDNHAESAACKYSAGQQTADHAINACPLHSKRRNCRAESGDPQVSAR